MNASPDLNEFTMTHFIQRHDLVNFLEQFLLVLILKVFKSKMVTNKLLCYWNGQMIFSYDDVIKWKHFPRYWPSVREIFWSRVNYPYKGHQRGALMFSFICARTNSWVNNTDAGDLRRHLAHCDVTVMHCFRRALMPSKGFTLWKEETGKTLEYRIPLF